MVQTGRIEDPLPQLAVWIMCRKLQGDSLSRLLPDAGGVLDQSYELLWAFAIIDDQHQQELELQRNLEESKQNREELRQSLLRHQA